MITKDEFEKADQTIREWQIQENEKLPYVVGTYNWHGYYVPATRNKKDGRVRYESSRFGGKGRTRTFEFAPNHLEKHFEPNKII